MLDATTSDEINRIISSLKNDVSAGVDDIKTLPLKHVSSIISPVLSHIINSMLLTGVFPDDLKVAKVIPVHKGGDSDNLQNYRPISVLPVISKIFESVINQRLDNFFNKHDIITHSQYGFQKNKSAEQALLNIKDEIVGNIENRLYTIGLFLDLKKAFDTVQHDILCKKNMEIGFWRST